MKGFTLIELLVVVLIIGILASIALPQYELAVEKSRATEAMINGKAIRDAVDRHMQEFPDEPVTAYSQIADVQLKGSAGQGTTASFITKNFLYQLSANSLLVCRRPKDASSVEDGCGPYIITYSRNTTTGDWTPSQDKCEEDYTQVCKLFTSL